MSALPSFSAREHAAASQPGRRRASRLRVTLPAQFTAIAGVVRCTLDNISQTGARIAANEHGLRIGAEGFLECGGVEMFGTIVWRRNGFYGIEFDRPVKREDMIRLRDYNDAYPEIHKQELRNNARLFVQGARGVV